MKTTAKKRREAAPEETQPSEMDQYDDQTLHRMALQPGTTAARAFIALCERCMRRNPKNQFRLK